MYSTYVQVLVKLDFGIYIRLKAENCCKTIILKKKQKLSTFEHCMSFSVHFIFPNACIAEVVQKQCHFNSSWKNDKSLCNKWAFTVCVEKLKSSVVWLQRIVKNSM